MESTAKLPIVPCIHFEGLMDYVEVTALEEGVPTPVW